MYVDRLREHGVFICSGGRVPKIAVVYVVCFFCLLELNYPMCSNAYFFFSLLLLAAARLFLFFVQLLCVCVFVGFWKKKMTVTAC